MVADLFAAGVGFYASWGFSRSLTRIRPALLTAAGHVDWRETDCLVAQALSDVLAAPPDNPADLPQGATAFPAELYVRVAVGQHCSGWAGAPAGAQGERLAQLRCHTGKRRVAGLRKNLVLVQYRVWTREDGGPPVRVTEAAKAWPLLEDLHAEVRRQTGG